MTAAERPIAEGLEQGAGVVRAVLRRQRGRRFGSLPPDVADRVAEGAQEALDARAERAGVASRLEVVIAPTCPGDEAGAHA